MDKKNLLVTPVQKLHLFVVAGHLALTCSCCMRGEDEHKQQQDGTWGFLHRATMNLWLLDEEGNKRRVILCVRVKVVQSHDF